MTFTNTALEERWGNMFDKLMPGEMFFFNCHGVSSVFYGQISICSRRDIYQLSIP